MDSDYDREKDKYVNKYVCDWCGTEFEQVIGKIDNVQSPNSNVSDQVLCKVCGNFNRTWK